MKTKHLIMAMAALAMAGCSQNEITEQNPDANPAIGFNVYTGTQTRGAEATTPTLQNDGFGILAYATGATAWAGSTETPNFMYNQEVTHSGSWSYTPVKYWPKNTTDKITFFGYAPYESAPDAGTDKGIVLSGNTDQSNPTITFTVKDAASDMIDLVTDESKKDQTSATASGTVAFNFKHILSRVKLVAKMNSALVTDYNIVIKSAKILGSTNHPATKFYKTAKYTTDLSAGTAGTWATGTATFTSDYDLAGVLNTGAVTIKDYSVTNGIKISSSDATNDIPLFKTDNYLFLIPVTSLGAEDIKLTIEYDIVSTDAGDSSKTVVSHETATVKFPAGTLVKGTAYKYTFNISMNEIVVTGEVDSNGWGNDTDGSLGA